MFKLFVYGLVGNLCNDTLLTTYIPQLTHFQVTQFQIYALFKVVELEMQCLSYKLYVVY